MPPAEGDPRTGAGRDPDDEDGNSGGVVTTLSPLVAAMVTLLAAIVCY